MATMHNTNMIDEFQRNILILPLFAFMFTLRVVIVFINLMTKVLETID